MGCTSNRDSSQFIEQNTFLQVENRLGLTQISCFSIDSALYRFAKDSKLTKAQFQACCQSLSLDFRQNIKFFDFFLKDKHYEAHKLSLLGVLYGKGTEDEKFRVLFQNYDFDCSKSLDNHEVRALVNDLMEISCFFVPQYVDSLYENQENISKYCMNVRLSYKSYQNEIIDMIMEEKQSIDEKSFYVKMKNNKKLNNLIKSCKIRKMVHQAFKNVMTPIAYVNFILENGKFDKLMTSPKRGHKRSFSF